MIVCESRSVFVFQIFTDNDNMCLPPRQVCNVSVALFFDAFHQSLVCWVLNVSCDLFTFSIEWTCLNSPTRDHSLSLFILVTAAYTLHYIFNPKNKQIIMQCTRGTCLYSKE